MNCPRCGEVVSGEILSGEACRCHAEPLSTVASEPSMELDHSSAAPAVDEDAAAAEHTAAAFSDTWRDELSARLSQYRARRKARPPRYPSLRLPFEPPVPSGRAQTAPPTQPAPVFNTVFEPVSAQALALDPLPMASAEENPAVELAPTEERSSRGTSQSVVHGGAKIIEFPRFAWGPPPAPPDQLAEPVFDRPRILEVPEIVPPPPALGGITIEAPERKEAEKRPGIDTPLQTASPARRVLANAIDAVIVAAASALFAFIFWKVAAIQPPKFQLIGLALGVPALLWGVYQYLLITYAGNTPGLRLAGLKLARFDGSLPRRSLRRWRVLASYLSAASLGMGYAWAFLDEDGLCWHDRATHTHLARK
jgi:uncharacterized RDD family membrane protein YckC